MTITVRVARDGQVLKSYGFDQDLVRIGRDPACEICLPSLAVSRLHIRIRKERGGYVLVDEGSSNGTRLNGSAVTATSLESGDHVSIGGFTLWIEILSGPPDPIERSSAVKGIGDLPTARLQG